MNEHGKKMIAPILVSICFIIYLLLYFGFLIYLIPNVVVKIFVGIIPAVIFGVIIFVCIQRIKEIKGGEEDDLSKY